MKTKVDYTDEEISNHGPRAEELEKTYQNKMEPKNERRRSLIQRAPDIPCVLLCALCPLWLLLLICPQHCTSKFIRDRRVQTFRHQHGIAFDVDHDLAVFGFPSMVTAKTLQIFQILRQITSRRPFHVLVSLLNSPRIDCGKIL